MPCTSTKSLAPALIAVVLAVVPTIALAQPPSPRTRLTYTLGPGTEGCPDEQGFRDGLAAPLGGVDPFAPDGGKRMDVTITRRERDFAGQIALYAEDGRPIGAQDVTGPTCAAVVQDIVTVIGIALRPSAPPPLPIVPASSPPPPPPAPPPAARPPEVPATPASPLRVEVGAGTALGGGFAPALSVGFGALVGLRWPAASLSLEGRADLPAATDPAGDAHFQTSWLGGSLAGCLQPRWLVGCGLVSVGRVRAAATANATPDDGAAAYLGIGARFGLEAPFSSRFAGQLTADVLVNALRPTIRLQGDRVWSVATVSELGALRLLAFF